MLFHSEVREKTDNKQKRVVSDAERNERKWHLGNIVGLVIIEHGHDQVT